MAPVSPENLTMKWIYVAECLYRKCEGGTIYIRVSKRVCGKRKRIMRSTETANPTKAKLFLQRWRDEGWSEKYEVVLPGPQLHEKMLTISDLLNEYVAAGHPARGRVGRTKSVGTVKREQRFLEPIGQWWGNKNPNAVTLADCDQYRDWRNSGGWITKRKQRDGSTKSNRTRGGDTAVDHELDVLSCVLHLARRRDLIRQHPLIGRGKYVSAADVRHCRDVAPTREELHRIEQWLRDRGEHEVADFVCFLAYTGLRIGEALPVRWDSVNWTEEVVQVQREKEGVNPWIALIDDLKVLLTAMRQRRDGWERDTGLVSEYLFPSPFEPDRTRDDSAIRHRLTAACKALNIRHVTPHGLRSYFVTGCREAGLTDAEIAMLIGDKSGPAIIAHTYGDVRDDHLLRQVKRIKLRWQGAVVDESTPQSRR
jgi:integrase